MHEQTAANRSGALINVEIDLVARYLARLLQRDSA